MPLVYRIVLFATHAALVALVAFPQALPFPVAAKPIALTSLSQGTIAHHMVERSSRVLKSKGSKSKAVLSQDNTFSPTNTSSPPARDLYVKPTASSSKYHRSGDINLDTVAQNINILNGLYTKANSNANNLQTYSSQASASRQDGAFEQDCASELTAFYTNSRGFQTTLAQLGADKGLAFYNHEDTLETLLKDIVNAHKNVLSSVTELTYSVPVLGPILGPIVYDIKCILDEILDATENLTDAIINACQPTLKLLIGEYGDAACSSGIDLVGICL
ncbi:hypothetical protein BC834DRAFT_437858 [Gloeopeniophorella convolvens]|nr:hypothetical protein BC834DRAFT_437858 [Gloeopeniophorella convolvens]